MEPHSFDSKRASFLQLRLQGSFTESWINYGLETFDLLYSSSTHLYLESGSAQSTKAVEALIRKRLKERVRNDKGEFSECCGRKARERGVLRFCWSDLLERWICRSSEEDEEKPEIKKHSKSHSASQEHTVSRGLWPTCCIRKKSCLYAWSMDHGPRGFKLGSEDP